MRDYPTRLKSPDQKPVGVPEQIDQRNGHANTVNNEGTRRDGTSLLCGPLLNYKGMSNASSWQGSVLIVLEPGVKEPEIRVRLDHLRSNAEAAQAKAAKASRVPSCESLVTGVKLYEDPTKAFWRFIIDLPLQSEESFWQYSFTSPQIITDPLREPRSSYEFVVPAKSQSMRMMFHSCNGFSVGTDEDAWSGPALWNDVLSRHMTAPFHVMIGGGDQIYNDSVRVNGPLKAWTDISNPKRRRDYPFDDTLRAGCDTFYYNNYVQWYSAKPFCNANSTIPQINIWDDHDIIDGFGSYTDHFMKCPVFRGIGSVSFKYYCLFQLHIPPPTSSFTTSAQETLGAPAQHNGDGSLSQGAYVRTESPDQSQILGKRPGPYITEQSRSLWMRLGARVGFLGIDARTERTRHQVNYPDTYDAIFDRVRAELSAGKEITHLVLLLGVPIAYPRLIWLENIFTSPIIGPIRFLSKRFGVAGGLFNHFDGQVDLLDDLDDHYTARQHKHERKYLILRLQALALEYNVRVTILGGDVHLGAIGRFYSSPKLGLPVERDHRYMTNVISSAITNKPPPRAVADLLARRNKIHHLDSKTDETLMQLFDKDPGNSNKTANHNRVTMPSRNYAIIFETQDSGNPSNANGMSHSNGHVLTGSPEIRILKKGKSNDGHRPLHSGEKTAGTKHAVADGIQSGYFKGGLDVSLRVEIDQHDKEGRTEGYGFSSKLVVQ